MKLRIGEREYQVVTPKSGGRLNGGANMRSLLDLRRQSTEVFGFEIGMLKLDELEATARQRKAERRAAERAGDKDAVRRIDAQIADDGMVNIGILVFLSRRAAGDRCSLEDAVDVDLQDLEWIREPGDPDDEQDDDEDAGPPDPTLPAPGSPATSAVDRPAGAARKPGKGKRQPAKAGRSRT